MDPVPLALVDEGGESDLPARRVAHREMVRLVDQARGQLVHGAGVAGWMWKIQWESLVASALVRPSWMAAMVGSHATNALSLWMLECGWIRRAQAKAFRFPDDIPCASSLGLASRRS